MDLAVYTEVAAFLFLKKKTLQEWACIEMSDVALCFKGKEKKKEEKRNETIMEGKSYLKV